MQKIFIFMVISLGLSIQTFAEIRRYCKVKYKTEIGWSKEYTVEVQFVTGRELNKKTKSWAYSIFSNYCLFWFGEGKVAILEINEFLLGDREEFDREDFTEVFSFRYSIDCKQVNGEEKTKWEVTAKEFGKFIDPREND